MSQGGARDYSRELGKLRNKAPDMHNGLLKGRNYICFEFYTVICEVQTLQTSDKTKST